MGVATPPAGRRRSGPARPAPPRRKRSPRCGGPRGAVPALFPGHPAAARPQDAPEAPAGRRPGGGRAPPRSPARMNITSASTGPQLFPAKRRYQKTAVRRSVCLVLPRSRSTHFPGDREAPVAAAASPMSVCAGEKRICEPASRRSDGDSADR